MPDIIKILPAEVSNKIAAGEVVQRPSSVLKELLENSIDAKSTKIKVVVKDAGKNLIQVIDNGIGMTKNDMHLSFVKHATSKIREIDDIFSINSMGFRGEALAAICSISMVEMSSKSENENGYHIEIKGGRLVNYSDSNINSGTSIKVKNIFFNVPARRNFLKSDFVEFKHILDTFHRIAIAHPEIDFSFINNDEEIFYLKKETLKKRIISIFGDKITENLIPISENTDVAAITGFILKPEFSKKSRSNQYIFVNKRFIKSHFINHSISSSYEGLLRDGYYPGYFLFIDIDPKKLDVNVHPNKTEIKFEDDQVIYSIIKSIVKHSLGIYQITPILDFEQDPNMEISYSQVNSKPKFPSIEIDSNFNPFKELSEYNLDNNIEISSNIENELFNENVQFDQKIFQIFNKYIVSSSKSSLIIINQNYAHQRILYEKFLKSMFVQVSESQKLAFPVNIEISKKQLLLLNNSIDEFLKLGFEFKIEDNKLSVFSVPLNIENSVIEETINELLSFDKDSIKINDLSESDYFAKKLAKISAIKAGVSLDQEELNYIVNELFSCKEPNLSPFDKQIFITLNKNDLEKRFNG
ncbi:MAG: DNA mismatch repair endonuclease MutL [Bacteroidota bacterium]